MSLLHQIASHGDREALALDGVTVTYAELRGRVDSAARALLDGKADLAEERIAMLLPGGVDYVVFLLAIWKAGAVAVPLNAKAAVSELGYALANAGATRLIVPVDGAAALATTCADLGVDFVAVNSLRSDARTPLPDIAPTRKAMILFTSGTTDKPKGVVTTHGVISAQISTLVEAWAWSADDRIPLFLPLHHVHGIINVLCCALLSGARVDLYPSFDLDRIFNRIAAGSYTVFMAVPTIYVKMIQRLEAMTSSDQASVTGGFSALRLMVSGSAACPVPVHERWFELTGQVLLERYGMTEIGMALSNPYAGERRPGAVGQPLPGVEIRLVDEDGKTIGGEGRQGEIWVRGPCLFLEYWQNPEATGSSFRDGWFMTGDIAVVEDGYYRILGRSSVDIIKSGGYKLSALEIEGVLLEHADIAECAVVGLADDMWGEAVIAAVVLKEAGTVSGAEIRDWCKTRMSSYKVPKSVHMLESLPRNAMGKVTKPAVSELLSALV